MKIQDILSTKFSVKAQPCYQQQTETRMEARGWVPEGTETYETITTQGDFSHFEYEMQLENSPKTISLTPLRYWQTIDINTTRIKQQLAYELVNECHLSKSQDKNMSLTIKELIDKSLELDYLELDSLAGLFEILSKNKQLDKTEVVQAIVSRITPEKLEQLTQEKIKSYSQSVDDYLGVTDAKQKGSFKSQIATLKGEIEEERKKAMLGILFKDNSNTEGVKQFIGSLLPFFAKEQVIGFLLNQNNEQEIKALNELLPKDLRVEELQVKEVITRVLNHVGAFDEKYSTKPETTEKPSTSCFGCCAQPSVSNEELVVGRE